MRSPGSEAHRTVEKRNQHALEAIEHAIIHISWLGQRQFMHLLEDERFRLTLPQFYTLLYLNQRTGGYKMSDLADATHQSAASLTGVIDRLLEKQLVARTRHTRDRRQVVVVVTPEGSSLLEVIKRARYHQIEAALAQFDDQDVAVLLRLLDQMLVAMGQALDATPHEQWV